MIRDRDVDVTRAKLRGGRQAVQIIIGPDRATMQALAPAPGTVTIVVGPGSTPDEFHEAMRRAHAVLSHGPGPGFALTIGVDTTQAEYIDGLRWIRALAEGERFVPFGVDTDALGVAIDVPRIPGPWQSFIGPPAAVPEDFS